MTQRKPGETDLDQQRITTDRSCRHNSHRFAGDETEVPKSRRNPVSRRVIIDMADQRLGAERQIR